MNRLDSMEKNGWLPFELDFVRAMGFRVTMDYDGEPLIEPPERLEVDAVAALIRRFAKGLKTRLGCDSFRCRQVYVGGPLGGQQYKRNHFFYGKPIVLHLARGRWATYRIRSQEDPRAFFVGEATNRRKARALWFSQVPEGGLG